MSTLDAPLRWAMLGTGSIAASFVRDLALVDDPAVDAIHVASPHPVHSRVDGHTSMRLTHGGGGHSLLACSLLADPSDRGVVVGARARVPSAPPLRGPVHGTIGRQSKFLGQ